MSWLLYFHGEDRALFSQMMKLINRVWIRGQLVIYLKQFYQRKTMWCESGGACYACRLALTYAVLTLFYSINSGKWDCFISKCVFFPVGELCWTQILTIIWTLELDFLFWIDQSKRKEEKTKAWPKQGIHNRSFLLLKRCCQLTGGKLLSKRLRIRITVGITVDWTCELSSPE